MTSYFSSSRTSYQLPISILITIYNLAHRTLDLVHLQSWFTTGAPQT